MRTPNDGPIDDEAVRTKLVTYMKKHGPSRAKSMTKSLRTPYERSLRILEELFAAGLIERVPGGFHRGDPVMAWVMKGDRRANAGEGERFTFGGAESLLAMQAAARSRLESRACA